MFSVSTQYRRMTDRRTYERDGRTSCEMIVPLCIASRAKKSVGQNESKNLHLLAPLSVNILTMHCLVCAGESRCIYIQLYSPSRVFVFGRPCFIVIMMKIVRLLHIAATGAVQKSRKCQRTLKARLKSEFLKAF